MKPAPPVRRPCFAALHGPPPGPLPATLCGPPFGEPSGGIIALSSPRVPSLSSIRFDERVGRTQATRARSQSTAFDHKQRGGSRDRT